MAEQNQDQGGVPMTMIQALRSGLDVMMGRDDNVIVYGEDVGYFGGVFRVTEGLQAKYGKSRCFDTPINESGIVGRALLHRTRFDRTASRTSGFAAESAEDEEDMAEGEDPAAETQPGEDFEWDDEDEAEEE